MTRSQPKLETRILESIRKDPVNVYAVTLHQRFYDEDGRDYWLAHAGRLGGDPPPPKGWRKRLIKESGQ